MSSAKGAGLDRASWPVPFVLAFAFLLLLIGLAGAPTASAYQGENLILTNPGPGAQLTGPAQTILTNPTFIDEGLDQASNLGKASSIRKGTSVTSLLPTIGRVLPWGIGALAAYEVCNAIVSGCWLFSQDSADPATSGSWGNTWTYYWLKTDMATAAGVIKIPAQTWVHSSAPRVYDETNNSCSATPWAGPGELLASPMTTCGSQGTPAWFAAPAVADAQRATSTSVGADTATPNSTAAVYCTPEGAGAGTCTTTPRADWADRTARLCSNNGAGAAAFGMTEAEAGDYCQFIASGVDSSIANPYVLQVDVPDCAGLLYAACAAQLQQVGLVPNRVMLDWEGAVVTLPADAVVLTQPEKGTRVDEGSTVTVTTNPDETGMPIIIPEREPGETASEYAQRLQEEGLQVGRIVLREMSENNSDPELGPLAVTAVHPAPGTRLAPSGSSTVRVEHNASTMPEVAGSGWTAPPVSGIDLTPLGEVGIGCDKFPFGIFCWVYQGLGGWGNSAGCGVNLGVPFGSSIGIDDQVGVELCAFEPAMVVVRPVIAILAAFSLAWLFASSAMGFGAPVKE